MALKVKFPNRIYMIRGNHEDINISSVYGFENECRTKLGEYTENESSVYKAITDVFTYLPLAAVIVTPVDRIFCCHGGLSRHMHTIDEMRKLQRPQIVQC